MPDTKRTLEEQMEKPVQREPGFSAVKASWEVGVRSDLLRDFEVTGFKQAARKPEPEPPPR